MIGLKTLPKEKQIIWKYISQLSFHFVIAFLRAACNGKALGACF